MTHYLQRLVRPAPPRGLLGMPSRPAVQEIETAVETFGARGAVATAAEGSLAAVPPASLRLEGGQAQTTQEAGSALTIDHLARWITGTPGREVTPTAAADDGPADTASDFLLPLRGEVASKALTSGAQAASTQVPQAAGGDPNGCTIASAPGPFAARPQAIRPVAPVSPARPGQSPHREWPDRAPVLPTRPAPSRRDTARGVVEVRVGTIELTVRNPGPPAASAPAVPAAPPVAASPTRTAAPEPLRFSASRHHLRWS